MKTDADQSSWNADSGLSTDMPERLLRRGSQPLGLIDMRMPERLYDRTAGWVAQRFSLLDHWQKRYQSAAATPPDTQLAFAMPVQPPTASGDATANIAALVRTVKQATLPKAEASEPSRPGGHFRVSRRAVQPGSPPLALSPASSASQTSTSPESAAPNPPSVPSQSSISSLESSPTWVAASSPAPTPALPSEPPSESGSSSATGPPTESGSSSATGPPTGSSELREPSQTLKRKTSTAKTQSPVRVALPLRASETPHRSERSEDKVLSPGKVSPQGSETLNPDGSRRQSGGSSAPEEKGSFATEVSSGERPTAVRRTNSRDVGAGEIRSEVTPEITSHVARTVTRPLDQSMSSLPQVPTDGPLPLVSASGTREPKPRVGTRVTVYSDQVSRSSSAAVPLPARAHRDEAGRSTTPAPSETEPSRTLTASGPTLAASSESATQPPASVRQVPAPPETDTTLMVSPGDARTVSDLSEKLPLPRPAVQLSRSPAPNEASPVSLPLPLRLRPNDAPSDALLSQTGSSPSRLPLNPVAEPGRSDERTELPALPIAVPNLSHESAALSREPAALPDTLSRMDNTGAGLASSGATGLPIPDLSTASARYAEPVEPIIRHRAEAMPAVRPQAFDSARPAIVWRAASPATTHSGQLPGGGSPSRPGAAMPLQSTAAFGGGPQLARQVIDRQTISSTIAETGAQLSPASAGNEPAGQQIDIVELAEKVSRILSRQLAAERERRGMK